MKKETTLDTNQILNLIPNRYPIMLLDKICTYKPMESIRGVKNLTYNENFFQGHFPEKPIMPGVLMVEAIGQLVSVLLYLNKKSSKLSYFLTGIENTKFRKFAGPGDQLILEAEWQKSKKNIHWFNGKILVENSKIMETSLMLVEHRIS